MVKSPKRPPPRQSSRPVRVAAPVRFELENDEEIFDEIQSAADDAQPQFEGDVTRILKEHHEYQAKKTSARSTTFQTQKKAIYAAARKNAQEVATSGIAYLENARAKIQELKGREVSHEKVFSNFQQLCVAQEESIDSLLSVYSPLLDELAPRRSDQANAASEMVRKNPIRREAALKKFSKNARAHVEEARENERAATDASALIKHYKNLLCA
ncbi:hypothetical protein FPV67DRAFT_1662514 [Lyophyllum atratum]|nr:hypothetical protein FPV67DRAFT_1662514 [Lyophyllum atratum]